MDANLPDELRDLIERQIVFRQTQCAQLRLLYNDRLPSPSTLIIYGPKDAYKSETLEYLLHEQNVEYVLIDCDECLSQRHLLSKIFAGCVKKLDKQNEIESYERVDNINTLSSNLERLLHSRRHRLVVVLAAIDEQKGTSHTLLPALARLGDRIPSLRIVFTLSSPRPLLFHKPGIPYIHFPPYNRTEQVRLLIRDGPPPIPDLSVLAASIPNLAHPPAKTLQQIYTQFATSVYDTLIAPTTASLAIFQRTCHRLWPQFIWPLLIHEPVHGKPSKTQWDFAKLLSRNRALFQAEGEAALQDYLLHDDKHIWTFEQVARQHVEQQQQKIAQPATAEAVSITIQPDITMTPSRRLRLQAAQQEQRQRQRTQQTEAELSTIAPLLKFLSTLILLAAYLASHTPSKHDIVLFSRLSTASSTSRRKRRYLNKSRAGGISKTPTKSPRKHRLPNGNDSDDADLEVQTPTKKRLTDKELGTTTANGTPSTPKKERADRSMRAILEKTSSISRPFSLERLIAILRAIHPQGLANHKPIADKLYVELAELERLRLVVRVNGAKEKIGEIKRSAAAGGGVDAEDLLEEKWRCVVDREFVVAAGKYYGLTLEGWEIE